MPDNHDFGLRDLNGQMRSAILGNQILLGLKHETLFFLLSSEKVGLSIETDLEFRDAFNEPAIIDKGDRAVISKVTPGELLGVIRIEFLVVANIIRVVVSAAEGVDL